MTFEIIYWQNDFRNYILDSIFTSKLFLTKQINKLQAGRTHYKPYNYS